MNNQKILDRLDIPQFYRKLIPSLMVNGKPEALGLCPFHDDHNPSMSVNVETGLYHCPVCGAGGDVFTFWQKTKGVDFRTALQEIREMAGIIDTSVKPKIVATFEYKNENDEELYIKERIEPGRNGKPKEFVFKHLENGKLVLGRGCDPVFYNLPRVMKSKNVIVVEGEGKADLLNSWGLTATCLDTGASSPIKDEYIQILWGMESVIILPDNDEPGQNYACKIANALLGKVKDLKIVNLPGLQAKEDVKNWAKTSGNTREKLLEIVENTPKWVPSKGEAASLQTPNECGKYNIKISTINDMLQYKSPEILIDPFMYKNTLNLLQSLPGIGKSLIVLSIADALTSNKPLFGHFKQIEKGKVLIVDEENPGSIHRDRIEKIGINEAAQIHFVHYQGIKVDNPKWLEALIKLIYEGKYVLVIFDALIRMHSAKENDSDEMSKVMRAFREIVRRGITTVVIIHHERKSRDGEKRERSRGSGDIVGAIDSQLILEEGTTTDEGKELILHPGKTRLKSFAPIRLVLNPDTLHISYKGNAVSSTKCIIQQIVQFLGDKICCYEEIQDAVQIPDKQLRSIIKKALGKELILDSTLKQSPDYKGAHNKQFYKVKHNPLLSSVAAFPPIGGETRHTEESLPGESKLPGNAETLDSVECGGVSKHGLPRETLTKKRVSEGAKKEGVGNIENAKKNEDGKASPDDIKSVEDEIPEVEFVEVIQNV